MNKDKKGFLLSSETLKIIVAVICIVFLVYLLVALYYSFTGEEKIKQAESSLKDIVMKEINRIADGGEYNEQGIHVPNPSDWFIFSFVGDKKKPNLCTGQNCICICEEVFPDWFDWQIKRCDEKGSCNVLPTLKEFEKIKIEKNGIDISIKNVDGSIEIKKNGS